MSDPRPRTPGGSLIAVESREHASAVITSLRSALASQKRYQTGEGIGRAAFDGMVSRAKESSYRRQDLAARAEAALISGVSSAPSHTTSAPPPGKGSTPSAAGKNLSRSPGGLSSTIDVMSKVPARAPNKVSARAAVMAAGGDDFSSDEDESAQVSRRAAAPSTGCTDDPALYGLPPRAATATRRVAAEGVKQDETGAGTRTGGNSSKPSKNKTNKPNPAAAPVCMDDPALYGVPARGADARVPALPVPQLNNGPTTNRTINKITAKVGDDFDFSSDDDEDTNKYTRHMDAPPMLPDDDMMCVSARGRSAYEGDDDEGLGPSATRAPSNQSAAGPAARPTKGTRAPKPNSATSNARTSGPTSGGGARSMSAGGNGISSPNKLSGGKNNASRSKKKIALGDFSDDERDDDELAIEHDLFDGDAQEQTDSAISYSDAVKKPTKHPEADPDRANRNTTGLSTGRGKPFPLPTGRPAADSAESGKRAIIKPGQGIKVVRGGKKTVR